MQEPPVQILEVRRAEGDRPVTITLAVSDAASRAIFTALSEQLDRRRAEGIDSAEAVLALRDRTALAERFETPVAAGAHVIVSLSATELQACLLELTEYAERVDGDHFQPVELRDRLSVIAAVNAAMWDANAAAAAAGDSVSRAEPLPW